MRHTTKPFTFKVKLSQEAHHIASQFRRQQLDFHNAQQVYLNTLAVYAVNNYLKQNGIETNLEASDSWNLAIQSLVDIADLEVKDLGKLECRPVFSDTNFVYIPAEVWEDRIAYVAVQMNESLTEATLLGFTKTATTEEFAISQLQTLEGLPKYLNDLKKCQRSPVNLNQWFENVIEAGWQTFEELFGKPEESLAFRRHVKPEESLAFRVRSVKRVKPLQLGMQLASFSVALALDLTQEANQKVRIRVQVHSFGDNIFLPEGLKLMVLDDEGEVFLEASAGSADRLIQTQQFQFVDQPEGQFTVKVVLDETTITEDFVI
jgi:hypothetical protein